MSTARKALGGWPKVNLRAHILPHICWGFAALMSATPATASQPSWNPIRISGSGQSGWQPVVCDHGSGWKSCEMPISIFLSSNPPSIAATGEVATITATLMDFYGVNLGKGIDVVWKTTAGTLSSNQSLTDEGGVASVQLKSSAALSGAVVTASTAVDGGQSNSIFIPFTDKWVAITSIYTAWSDYGELYNCSEWSPNPNTVSAGVEFVQTASCTQNQVAYRQDREQSVVTGAIRPVGNPAPMYQAIPKSASRNSMGTKPEAPITPPGECKYGLGGYVWTYAPTVESGSGFAAWIWEDKVGIIEENITSVTQGNYIYYRGEWVDKNVTYDNWGRPFTMNYHQICRKQK